MTEEERMKTILELERQVCKFPTKPEELEVKKPKVREVEADECEVCGDTLEDGECYAHPQYVRMHRRALNNNRETYEKKKDG